NKLLLLVSLGNRGDTGLLQNRVTGKVSHHRRNVRGRDIVFRRSQVLRLVVNDTRCTLQAVDSRSNIAAQGGNNGNRVVDQRQSRLRVGLGQQIVDRSGRATGQFRIRKGVGIDRLQGG